MEEKHPITETAAQRFGGMLLLVALEASHDVHFAIMSLESFCHHHFHHYNYLMLKMFSGGVDMGSADLLN